MYFETVASETSKPSFNGSPRILGAPYSGLARHMLRIKLRIAGKVFAVVCGRNIDLDVFERIIA